MLSASDEARIAEGLSSSDHDYFALSGLAGEPFLRDGLLCFFDGMTVHVVGFPLGSDEADCCLKARLDTIIAEWAREPGARFIYYFGPVAIDTTLTSPWTRRYADDPYPWNQDVFIDLTHPVISDRKLRQDVRRARSRGLEVTTQHRDYLGHEHIRLITDLVSRTDMAPPDTCSYTNLVSVLRAPCSMVIEARHAGRLVGFAVTHRFFHSTAMMIGAAFDRECRGASDAVYAAALNYYQDAGVSRLGFGYATDESLFRYKTKWGTSVIGRPFFQRIWANEERESCTACVYWPWRLLHNNWRRHCLAAEPWPRVRCGSAFNEGLPVVSRSVEDELCEECTEFPSTP